MATDDERPWFERVMSQPRRDISSHLIRDHDIRGKLRGAAGIAFFQQEKERRIAMDHTDLVYFDRLHVPDTRRQIKRLLGQPLPPGCL